MNDPPSSDPTDPIAWRGAKAPSLDEIEVLAAAAFRRLPQRFRQLCGNLVIRVEDFPGDDVIEEMGLESEFDLLGLFHGVGLPFQSESAPAQMPNLIWLYQGVGLPFRAESDPIQMPNMIWLYRRPILDYWAEHDETLGRIVTHVLLHEIGHHFGFSDEDIAAIEADVA
jgi:predicted Zn-dependent protease with MMP-like domain